MGQGGGRPGHGAARYDRIDALRALAMMAVIAQHTDIFPIGWLGVWIFYVISGFVVTLSIRRGDPPRAIAGDTRRAIARDKGAALAGFYIRRAARIIPLYWLYVALAGFITFWLPGPDDPWEILSQASFTYNFYLLDHPEISVLPTTHLWTISVEMQFYALAGVAIVLLSDGALKRCLAGVVAGCLLGRIALIGQLQHFNQSAHISFLHFDAFSAGCLLALYRARIGAPQAGFLMMLGVMAMALLVAVYAVVNHHLGAQGIEVVQKILSGDGMGQGRGAFIFSAATMLGVGCVAMAAAGRGWFPALLGWGWLARIGRASYSGYLLHFAVIEGLYEAVILLIGHDPMHSGTGAMQIAFRLALCVGSIGMTVLLADLCYRWLEMPLARLCRVLLEKCLLKPVRA
ncbi:acyltransferase family protein [Novosphingobium rosa]|uniref:acyltransferase family protein n=1 Tax=Novosphingobium rosa TaxID=76978 RepID=UPI00082B55BD|nr:acyltransferase [Novosphingobium rosa]